jgi:O-antigen/teichoic acid export membrane protein
MASRHYLLSAVNTGTSMLISFVGNILLARILSPDDYGLIAMLAIFMAIAMNFTDSGLSDYLISKKDADDADYATVRVHNIAMAVVFYAALFASSGWIARFYGRCELVGILHVIAVGIVFKALTLSEITKLRKKLLFGRIAAITTLGNVLALAAAYYCAFAGFGYWALVVQSVVQAASLCVFSYLANRELPVLRFSGARYREMRRFGNNMLLSYITNQFGENMASVVIGKFYTAASLGAYGQAQKLSTTIFGSVNAVVLTTSYPLIAKEASRNKRRKLYGETLSAFLFVHYAVLIPLIFVAPEMILVFLGQKWAATIPYLQLVLLSIFFQPLVTLNLNISKTEGHTHVYRNMALFRNFLSLSFLLVMAKYSIIAIVAGQVVARGVSAIVTAIACGRLIGFRLGEQLRSAAHCAVGPVASAALAWIACTFLTDMLQRLVVFSVMYLLLFVGTGVVSKNKTMMIFMRRVRKR